MNEMKHSFLVRVCGLTSLALSMWHCVCVQQLDGPMCSCVQVLLRPSWVQLTFRLQQTQGHMTHKKS